MGTDPTDRRDHAEEAPAADPDAELTRGELEDETAEKLPDREGTFNALSDQATVEQNPEAEDGTTTRGGLDV